MYIINVKHMKVKYIRHIWCRKTKKNGSRTVDSLLFIICNIPRDVAVCHSRQRSSITVKHDQS